MRVGFIGAGHEVVLSSSRGPEALAGLVADLGPAASAGPKQEAAECAVVILATSWTDAPEALKGIDWSGRILVDGTNAHIGEKPDISTAGVARSVAALEGRTSSEIVAAPAPGARLVKSISNMPMSWIQDFSPQKPKTNCSCQETIAMPRRSWSNL
jgi:predicted dinucleotide-binding enzyme